MRRLLAGRREPFALALHRQLLVRSAGSAYCRGSSAESGVTAHTPVEATAAEARTHGLGGGGDRSARDQSSATDDLRVASASRAERGIR